MFIKIFLYKDIQFTMLPLQKTVYAVFISNIGIYTRKQTNK